MPEKEYKYIRKYIDKDGNILDYTQSRTKNVVETDLKRYIKKSIKIANSEVYDIKDLENLLKAFIRYKGYNNKNLNNRLYNLEQSDDITLQDRKLIRELMDRQKGMAIKLSNTIKWILELYKEHDIEIDELSKQLQEYVEK